MDAPLFAQDIDNIEFSPKILQAPPYVKVRSRNKRDRDFDKLFLAQELKPSSATGQASIKDGKVKGDSREDQDAIWAVGFTRDGKYLASAGQDTVVRVWAVISTPEEREAHELEEDVNPVSGKIQIRASVFQTTPIREYRDHEGAVLDLSWSKVIRSISLQPLSFLTFFRIIFS
jgi:WD40 repeat protein